MNNDKPTIIFYRCNIVLADTVNDNSDEPTQVIEEGDGDE